MLDQKTQVGFLEPTWGYSMSKGFLMASSGFCEHYIHGAQAYMQVKHHRHKIARITEKKRIKVKSFNTTKITIKFQIKW